MGDGDGSARVFFWRTFQLSGSATGWNVSLESLLTGSIHAEAASNGDAWVTTGATAYIVEGGITGSVIIPGLGFYREYYSSWNVCHEDVWISDTQQRVLADGIYTVIGELGGWGQRMTERGNTGLAWSSFFGPPGLVVEVDAVPRDQSPPPTISLDDVSVTERHAGTSAANFTVALSAPSSDTVTVEFTTANGTAVAGNDYLAANGTLSFAPGEVSKIITVLANGDRLAEENEEFFLNLRSAVNATLADAQGIGTILDDEPRISVSDVTKAEGKKGQSTLFTFVVTLSAAYDQAVTISFGIMDGTAWATDRDYIPKTGTITFMPGETTKTITIQVKGDSKKEANETFYLDLFGNGSNSLFTKKRGIGTILNDD
jgi:hypothetical protein